MIDIDRIMAAKQCKEGHTWNEIARHLGGEKEAIRSAYRRRPRGRKTFEACPLCTEPTAGESGTTWEENGNQATASVTGERIRTLDQLLKAAEVDLDTWQIVDWGVKKWEVGAKIKRGEIHWRGGGIDHGDLVYEGLGIQDLWSVWAKFIRREPVAIQPAVQPIRVDFRLTTHPVAEDPRKLRRAVIIPDAHIGYTRNIHTGQLTPLHDRRALDVALQIIGYVQPDRAIIEGDFLDLPMWTDKFARSPEFYWTTQPAIIEAHYILRRIRELVPMATVQYFEGNHEARLQKMLEAHLSEAYGLRAADELRLPAPLSVERLLALRELGIEWVGDYPDGERWLGNRLRVEHGAKARSTPGGSARAVIEDSDQDVIFGHVHRIESVSRRVRSRAGWRTIRAHSFGCLCHIDGRVPGADVAKNWQQGIGIVEFTEHRHYTAIPVEIIEGEALYDSLLWIGQDYTPDLEQAAPGFHW